MKQKIRNTLLLFFYMIIINIIIIIVEAGISKINVDFDYKVPNVIYFIQSTVFVFIYSFFQTFLFSINKKSIICLLILHNALTIFLMILNDENGKDVLFISLTSISHLNEMLFYLYLNSIDTTIGKIINTANWTIFFSVYIVFVASSFKSLLILSGLQKK